jgi:hypothetical protein
LIPEFKPVGPQRPYNTPCEIRLRHESAQLQLFVDEPLIFSIEQSADTAFKIPVISIARQDPGGSVLIECSPAVVGPIGVKIPKEC